MLRSSPLNVSAAANTLQPLGRVVMLDFETTQSPTSHRPVEIAAILVEDGHPAACLDTLISPGCSIDPFSQAVHGITDRDVRHAPSFPEVWSELEPMLAGSIVVAHNAVFDSQVLRNEIQRLSLAPPPVEWWCTLRLARRLWPGIYPSYSLGPLGRALGLQGRCDHRALADTELALELLCRQIAEARRRSLSVPDGLRPLAAHRGGKSWPWPHAGEL